MHTLATCTKGPGIKHMLYYYTQEYIHNYIIFIWYNKKYT